MFQNSENNLTFFVTSVTNHSTQYIKERDVDKLLLRTLHNRRIFLIGCTSENDMMDKRYQIKKSMVGVGDVEFIYQGSPDRIKPYVAARAVDSHPPILNKAGGKYDGGKYRNYTNLTVQSHYNALESLQSAIQLYHQQFGLNPSHILIVQVQLFKIM